MSAAPTIRSASLLSLSVAGGAGRTVSAGGDGFALLLARPGANAPGPTMTAPAVPTASIVAANHTPVALLMTGGEAGGAAAPPLPDDPAPPPSFVTASDRLTVAVTADPAIGDAQPSPDRRTTPVPADRAVRQPAAARGKPLPEDRRPDASLVGRRPGEGVADRQSPQDSATGAGSKTPSLALAPQANPVSLADLPRPEQVPTAAPDNLMTTTAASSGPLSAADSPASDVPSPGKPTLRRAHLLASATIAVGNPPSPLPAGMAGISAAACDRNEPPDSKQPGGRDDAEGDPALHSTPPQPAPVANAAARRIAIGATPIHQPSPAAPSAAVASPTLVTDAGSPRRATGTAEAGAQPPTIMLAAIVTPTVAPEAASLGSGPAPSFGRDSRLAPASTPSAVPAPPAMSPLRLVGGAALQALGTAATSPLSPAVAAADMTASTIVAVVVPVPVASPPTTPTSPALVVDTSMERFPTPPGSSAEPATPQRPAPESPAAIVAANPVPTAPTRSTVGTTAPAGTAFAAAIEAADRQDRLVARGAPTASVSPAVAIASIAPSAASTGAGADQPSLDMRRQGWPAAMVDHIEKLRDAVDATSTRIRVVPDALGSIDVSVRRHDDGAVQVSLVADRPQTQALIAEARPELTRLADERGTRIDVNVGGTPAGNTASFGGNAGGRQPATQPQVAQRRAPASALPTDDSTDPADGRVA